MARAVLLASLLVILVGCSNIGKRCFTYGTSLNKGNLALVKNRFEHSTTDDVIDVYSKTLTKALGKPTELGSVALRNNEVEEYCHFSKPIVFLGKTNVGFDAVPG